MGLQDSKAKLLDATLKVVRSKGYSAARVEDICAEAGVTKGSFFHHFKSKDDLALAAVTHWNDMTGHLFANAAYHGLDDPLDRVLGYIELRKDLLRGELADFTCFVGTITQEAYQTRPDIVEACAQSIKHHAATLEADIKAAMDKYGVADDCTPQGLALHTQAVIQGAFILAKATGGPDIAAQSINHLKRYVTFLFGQAGHSLASYKRNN